MTDKHSAHGPLAAALFYAVNGALFPATVLGYGVWVGKVLASRRSGASLTAQGPLSTRWLQHQLGTREDEASNRLMPELLGMSPRAMRLSVGTLLLAHRVSGYVPKAFRYPFEGDVPPPYEASARVAFFDRAVETHLAHVDQLVLLGAGFDTRALRLPSGARTKCFEVDMPNTQRVKRDALARAGIDASGVTFVPADFEHDDWLAELVRAGFDPAKPALFLWEGVTMYLDDASVRGTLRKIAGLPAGTAVAFDYFTTEPLESKALFWRYARVTTRAAGEPLTFGIDATPPSKDHLAQLLDDCGLSLVEHETLGRDTPRHHAWGGFALAAVS